MRYTKDILIKGNKLTRQAAKGRIGLRHPTRGLIPAPSGRFPFSSTKR